MFGVGGYLNNKKSYYMYSIRVAHDYSSPYQND